MSRATDTYTDCGDFAGYSVRGTRTGWLIESWSAIQGSLTGERRLVPYGAPIGPRERAPERGADLHEEVALHPAGSAPRGWLLATSAADHDAGRILRRGREVR